LPTAPLPGLCRASAESSPQQPSLMTGTSPSSTPQCSPVPARRTRFGPPYQPNGQLRGVALSAVRCIVSFLFACHGAKILLGVFGGIDEHGASVPVGLWTIRWTGVRLESSN
jgi:hypothetical protein